MSNELDNSFTKAYRALRAYSRAAPFVSTKEVMADVGAFTAILSLIITEAETRERAVGPLVDPTPTRSS